MYQLTPLPDQRSPRQVDRLLRPLEQAQGLPLGVGRIAEDAFAIRCFDRGCSGARIHTEDYAPFFRIYPINKYRRVSYRTIVKIQSDCPLYAAARLSGHPREKK